MRGAAVLLGAGCVIWAALPPADKGYAGFAVTVAIAGVAGGGLRLALTAVPVPEDSYLLSAGLRAWLTFLAAVRLVPWEEGALVAIVWLEVLHPARPWHTAVLGAGLIAYLLVTHLAESDAGLATLRPQARVLGVGAVLLALGAAAGMLPAAGLGAGSALLRLVAAGALIAAAGLVLPYVARRLPMLDDPVNPEDCLRSLAAEALRWAPHRPLFPDSLRLMAVANAFVMLGLLPEPRAEAVLAEHRSALEHAGFGNAWGVTKGELTVRPGAHGYWQSRMAGPGGLREFPAGGPRWHASLAYRWGRRARQQAARFRAGEHRRLVVRLPLEHATAVIESVSAQGELVSIQLYGHPWVTGEYWPMITPCFQVRAVDDAGNEYVGMPGDWRGFPGDEGSGSFWFWPPVPSGRKSIRVTVSTLWEAAWADIELPR